MTKKKKKAAKWSWGDYIIGAIVVISFLVMATKLIKIQLANNELEKQVIALSSNGGIAQGEVAMVAEEPEPEPEPKRNYFSPPKTIVCDTSCWHEVAHRLCYEGGEISTSKEFRDAVFNYLSNRTKEPEFRYTGEYNNRFEIYIDPLVHLIVTFPGFFGDRHGDDGNWGGWTELYAAIFQHVEGRRDDLPYQIEDFYDYEKAIKYYKEVVDVDGDFCAQWAFGFRDSEAKYDLCMEGVK